MPLTPSYRPRRRHQGRYHRHRQLLPRPPDNGPVRQSPRPRRPPSNRLHLRMVAPAHQSLTDPTQTHPLYTTSSASTRRKANSFTGLTYALSRGERRTMSHYWNDYLFRLVLYTRCTENKGTVTFFYVSSIMVFHWSLYDFLTEVFVSYSFTPQHSGGLPLLNYVNALPCET